MEHRRLGRSGLRISTITMGTMTFGGTGDFAKVGSTGVDEARRQVDICLEAGVTLYDTADIYSDGLSEEITGEVLQGRRDDVLLATKARMVTGPGPNDGGASRHHLVRSCERSLRRLRTDHIDLYQLHQPDLVTPVEETLQALGELVVEGKVRYVGCSNFAGWEVTRAAHVARALGVPGFVTAQNEYSLYNRVAEEELVPACLDAGVGLLPYFPLAYGLLTGKYSPGNAPEGSRLSHPSQEHRLSGADFSRVTALQEYADARGVSLLEVAIGGLAAQPAVGSVIAGVSKASQVRSNAAAAAWVPTADDLDALQEVNRTPLPGMTHRSYTRS
jgi:aryl-alcohol dehydrogenase-like predicted oxidoreductase